MTKNLFLDALIGLVVCIVGVLVLTNSSPNIVYDLSASISSFVSRVLGR